MSPTEKGRVVRHERRRSQPLFDFFPGLIETTALRYWLSRGVVDWFSFPVSNSFAIAAPAANLPIHQSVSPVPMFRNKNSNLPHWCAGSSFSFVISGSIHNVGRSMK
jgi:hypothetical protein